MKMNGQPRSILLTAGNPLSVGYETWWGPTFLWMWWQKRNIPDQPPVTFITYYIKPILLLKSYELFMCLFFCEESLSRVATQRTSTNFNVQFNNTCMSHYYPRHVSGLDMPILRRNNCTNTASGILALELSERSYIKLVQGLLCC